MKQSYNRLNKQGRFLFWWFIISQLITITTLSVLMIFNYNFIALKNQISIQEATIKKLKKANDSNTASILRIVSQLENNGG
nr:MAG TPA: hypothetical protein [Caudoviricetes sp.]